MITNSFPHIHVGGAKINRDIKALFLLRLRHSNRSLRSFSITIMQASYHNAEAQAPRSSSMFLALLRELRDMIYNHALTLQSGLTSCLDCTGKMVKFYDKSTVPHGPEFNQLQHVSKQLRDETRSLALTNNTLAIVGTTAVEGTELAARFLSECSPKIKAKLREIHITNTSLTPPEDVAILSMAPPQRWARRMPAQLSLLVYDYSPLSRFCQAYPRTQVLLRCRLFTDEWLLSFGVMYHYQATFRGQREFKIPREILMHPSFYRCWEVVDVAEELALYLPVAALPDNLQIAVEQDIYDRMTGTRRHVTCRRKVADILEASKKFFED